jgi:phage terminase large subunit
MDMKSKSRIDQIRLRLEIRNMTYDSSLYKLLKEELSILGYWKALKRGKPNPMFKRH